MRLSSHFAGGLFTSVLSIDEDMAAAAGGGSEVSPVASDKKLEIAQIVERRWVLNDAHAILGV